MELDFNGQAAIGSGPLSYEAQRGMYLHPTYASRRSASRFACWAHVMWTREKWDKFGKRGEPKESLQPGG